MNLADFLNADSDAIVFVQGRSQDYFLSAAKFYKKIYYNKMRQIKGILL